LELSRGHADRAVMHLTDCVRTAPESCFQPSLNGPQTLSRHRSEEPDLSDSTGVSESIMLRALRVVQPGQVPESGRVRRGVSSAFRVWAGVDTTHERTHPIDEGWAGVGARQEADLASTQSQAQSSHSRSADL
jgi:hypothetical protein